MKNEIIDLFKEGKSYNEISKILGCSKSTISYHIKDMRNFKHDELKNRQVVKCSFCGKEKEIIKSRIRDHNFCSKSHKQSFFNNINKDSIKNWARKSLRIQGDNKRSKNEIYFSELCCNTFDNVDLNEPIFNGWNADVIIHELKIAVLWNGRWHYSEIVKGKLQQIQKRDEIKLKEIKKSGFTPYIIKDMGKYNRKFVEEQFEIFIEKTGQVKSEQLRQGFQSLNS